MKKILVNKKIKISIFLICLSFLYPNKSSALSPGALLYRTSGGGMMYGYSSRELLGIKNGILQHIYPGHVGMYIGQENGVHYVVEALAGGIVKTRAEYFVNEAAGEKLLGAKIPKEADFNTRLKAVKIAKALAEKNPGYDFSFQKQKGPNNGDWTCVGLVEKIYESAGILNPNNLDSLVYDSDYYQIDITPDGFDNTSFINDEGDCFSKKREFSKIAAKRNLVLPAPEKLGFNAGRLYKGERYIFIPYTQYLQSSLKNERVDIKISSSFKDSDIRGKTPSVSLLLKWTLVNNPLSSIRAVADNAISGVRKYANKIFGKNDNSLSLDSFDLIEDDPILANLNNSNKVMVSKADESSKDKQDSPSVSKNNNDVTFKEDNLSEPSGSLLESKIAPGENVKIKKDENKPAKVESKPSGNNLKVKKDETQSEINILVKNDAPILKNENKASPVLVKKQDVVENKKESVTKKPSTPSAASLKLANSKIKIGTKPDEAFSPGEENRPSEKRGTPSAYISKVYSTGMNDFIELYNPNDFDFDLAEAGFRIEKSKTADNPSIVMRIGNESDGIYPKGTVIKAKSYYLIVRDGANPYFLGLADAIGKRKEFGWTGNAYTLYLGKGAISSSDDADILDALGFGAATYYQGSKPALEIADNYYLNRVAFDNNNYTDFKLVPSNDPSISWDDYIDGGGEEDGGELAGDDNIPPGEGGNEEGGDVNVPGEGNNPVEGDEEIPDDNYSADFSPFVFPGTIEASDVSHLWHFNECHGDYDYTVGIFDCGLALGYYQTEFSKDLEPEVNLNKFSISFYYRDHTLDANNYPRVKLKLSNESGYLVDLYIEKGLIQIDGLPNSLSRYYEKPVFSDDDFNWRHFALVVDKEAGYWAVYINGEEMLRHEFIKSLPSNINSLVLSSDGGPASVDELAIWSEALSKEDIKLIIESQAPFAPYPKRVSQKYPVLRNFWNFSEGNDKVNEGGGNEAVDSIKGAVIDLADNSWIWREKDNTGIVNKWGKDISLNLGNSLSSSDMSIAFWWRSSFYPNDGRSSIGLYYNDVPKFVLTPSYFRRNYYFDGKEGLFSEGEDTDFTKDENWHHFIMTYDSYQYKLKLYVDGQIKKTFDKIYIKNDELPNRLFIANELNYVELDDLAIFEGALSATQAAKLYQGTLIDN